MSVIQMSVIRAPFMCLHIRFLLRVCNPGSCYVSAINFFLMWNAANVPFVYVQFARSGPDNTHIEAGTYEIYYNTEEREITTLFNNILNPFRGTTHRSRRVPRSHSAPPIRIPDLFCTFCAKNLVMLMCGRSENVRKCPSGLGICGRFPRCFKHNCAYYLAFSNMYD